MSAIDVSAAPWNIAPAQPSAVEALRRLDLLEHHKNQLVEGSAIDPAVVIERGYRSLGRYSGGQLAESQAELKRLGISRSGREDARFPGLLIPVFGPTGQRVSVHWRPDSPPKGDNGKPRKYLQPSGHPARLDVHPRNSRHMPDPTVPLWITEGVKKADSLTSRGACVVALAGVYNWRSKMGTLGEWEDVQLKGRRVNVCFDADARNNANVLRAMQRLGKWLQSRGAHVSYVTPPPEHNGRPTKGADDYFAAGGTLAGLEALATTAPPPVPAASGEFADAQMAETVADDVLEGAYVWCKGLGWLRWTGIRWASCSEESVAEAVRQYVLGCFRQVLADAQSTQQPNTLAIDGWRGMLGAGRIRAVLGLSRGIVERQAEDFDADTDLLNTPSGVVDLRTGELLAHDPERLITKVTRGSYRPGYTHPDWVKALTALPPEVGDWMQVRFGQAITGHPTPDGRLVILQGGGENAKSALSTDGVVPAAGDYGAPASRKLFQATKGSEHSTEMADLRGQRLLVAEELTEGRSIDVNALKAIQDVGVIKARYIRQDNITFTASHSLFCTTNHVPVVSETDHGTWRRLVLVRFPYRFRKPGEPMEGPNDRPGDPTLKARIKAGSDGQHDAIVTWLVEGARRWYAGAETGVMEPPAAVAADTRAWRGEADRVLTYWAERLVAEPGAMVATREAFEDFNRWLTEGGHSAWAKETFHARFRDHEETTRHRVAVARTRNVAALSRPGLSMLQALPAQPEVYTGVRFKTASDLH